MVKGRGELQMIVHKEDNYSKLKKFRNSNECLFKDIVIKCNSQGKRKIEKNHIIPKSSYLERISSNNKVMVFDFENHDYLKRKRKLTERNIKNANTYQVLCGEHDKFLFSEIENGKIFDENNKKQMFQFALRAFLFSFSERQVKSNFDGIVRNIGNKVANVHLEIDKKRLEKYKEYLKYEKWYSIETIIIKLDRKINFISCYYGQPKLGLYGPIKLGGGKISINIFPENQKTIILLSFLKDDPDYKAMKKHCEKLSAYARKNEKKFINYMNKFIIAFDHNIAINPEYWELKARKDDFYEIAHMFPKCKSVHKFFILLVKLKIRKCKFDLIPIEQ